MLAKVVGFGGRAESGKTTAAEMLVEIARPQRHVHIEFSDPIIQVAQAWLDSTAGESVIYSHVATERLSQILDWFIAQERKGAMANVGCIDPSYLARVADGTLSRSITAETKPSHRPLLEWLWSSAITLYSDTVWGDTVANRIHNASEEGTDLITVGGVRSITDHKVIKASGGQVIRLHRGGNDKANITERDIDDWVADFEIPNDGTLDSLHESLERAWRIIGA